MRNSPNKEDYSEHVGLVDRLFAAFLAPIFMNISVLIVVASVFDRSRYTSRMFYHYANIPFSAGKVYVISLCVIPAILGFVLGTTRFFNFAGHCFMTNLRDENNSIVITALIWACILGISYFVAKSISA